GHSTLIPLHGARYALMEQQGRDHELLPGLVSVAAASPKVPFWHSSCAWYRAAMGQVEAARSDLESLAVNEFRDIPPDQMWLTALCQLCGVVSLLGDAQRATMLYDLLLPYGGRCATPTLVACRGSVSRSLGLLATVLARYDEAERHFENALEMNARIRARIWVAHTQHDYARMLVARDGAGDRERAAALAAQALATARKVGMKPLEAKVVQLRAAAALGEEPSTAPVPEGPPAPAATAVFRRDGAVWTIAYEGKGLRLKEAKGVRYIARLLRHPGEECHCADLAGGGETEPARGGDASPIAAGLGDAGERLDTSARAAYRQRLRDLEAELAQA